MALTKNKPKKLLKKSEPAVKKARVKKKNNFLFKQIRIVPINSLKPHPDNYNIGDVETIQESLDENGQYKPIVVNRRNGLIAAGHHTWLAARAEGWTQIGIVEINVDEVEHLRIMAIDNESAKKSTYDESFLDRILQKVKEASGSTRGTGFSELDVEDLHTRVSQQMGSAMDSIADRRRQEQESEEALRRSQTFDGAPLGEEPDPTGDDDTDFEDAGEVGAGQDITKASEEIKGALTLKSPDDMEFDGIGYWGIPRLRTDMLMTFDELPAKLESWAGSATKDWPDAETWWLYNWAVDSTSGMRDVSKVILSFYTHDEYFESWWHYTERYTAKVLNSGIKYAVTPNFSQWSEDPHAVNMWSLYRSRLIARYFQEVGLKVIPDVNWPYKDEEFLTKHVLATLPKKLPLIAYQMQTYNPKEMSDADMKDLRRLVQLVFDTLKPKGLLLYAGKPGQKFFRENIKTGCPMRVLDTRNSKLSEKAKLREKKTTI